MLFFAAHNCVLYSPLSQDDTSDWISGNQIETYAADSMVWDSANGVWKFQHVSGQPYNNDQYAAKWQLANQIPKSRSNVTCCAELYAYNTSDNNVCYDFLPTRCGLGLYGTKNALTESAQVFESPQGTYTNQYQYRNGTQVFYYNYPSGAYTPSATETHFRIATFHNSYQAPVVGPFGIRNIAFFLQPLSISEINEYFSLI